MNTPVRHLLLSSTLAVLYAMPWQTAYASQCLSVGNGNWNNAATWSCGHVPVGGDTVIIQFEDTVSITQNHVYNGSPLQIQVYGVWLFSGGGSKITLPCGSHVEIMVGGALLPVSNSGGHSETVRICGVTYWHYDEGPQYGYQIWPGPSLPVELISFDAVVQGSSVVFTWVTASETNSSHFDLYRSREGGARELITTMPAQGYSIGQVSYEYPDIPSSDGLWYYHLVQVDLDGQATEKGSIAVMIRPDRKGISCLPNLVTENHMMITSGTPLVGSEVHIISAAHRMELRPHLLFEEERLLMLDLSGLSSGMYIARVITNGSIGGHCSFVIP